jgi:protein-tyrosine phosphatase
MLSKKAMITKITEKLYLGDALDAKLLQVENPLKIKAIVNVSYDPDEPVDEIANVYVPMMDDGNIPPKAFDVALAAIAENLRSGPVLVHCSMGVSRSVVVVALHLALTSGASLNTESERVNALYAALERVQNLRAQSKPSPETVKSGVRYLSHW